MLLKFEGKAWMPRATPRNSAASQQANWEEPGRGSIHIGKLSRSNLEVSGNLQVQTSQAVACEPVCRLVVRQRMHIASSPFFLPVVALFPVCNGNAGIQGASPFTRLLCIGLGYVIPGRSH